MDSLFSISTATILAQDPLSLPWIFVVSSCIWVPLQYLLYPAAWGCSKFSFIILKPILLLKNSVISCHCFRIEIKILNYTYKYHGNWHCLSLQLHHQLLSPPFWHFSHIRQSLDETCTPGTQYLWFLCLQDYLFPFFITTHLLRIFSLLLIFHISTHPSLSQALIPDWISFICPIAVLRSFPIEQGSSPFAQLTFWTR